MSWLWEPRDVGGLALGEVVAIRISRATGVFLAVAAFSTVVRPTWSLLVGVVLFQLAMATAAWQVHAGFPLDVAWLGAGPLRGVADTVVLLFPFAAGAARIAAPLTLILVHWSRQRQLLGVALSPAAEWIMRIAIALTFAAHGLEALDLRGSFLDMLIVGAHNLVGVRLPEVAARWLLVVIGVADLTVAALVIVTRLRGVALYMAVWGFTTAAARLVVLSIDIGWYEFAIRSAHWSLPLVLLLAWRLAQPASPVVD